MEVKKKVIEKLKILENRMNTNFNYTLFEERDVEQNLQKDEAFVYKYSKSEFHKTNFRLHIPFYKVIYQPFIQENEN